MLRMFEIYKMYNNILLLKHEITYFLKSYHKYEKVFISPIKVIYCDICLMQGMHMLHCTLTS